MVLYHVSFSQKQDWHYHTIEISKIHRVLLAENYADYMAVAKACSGFDPEWERKEYEINELSSQQLITTIFEPVKELDKTMPTRITQYILQGDELNVLVDLNQLCQSSNTVTKLYELLRRPCDLRHTDICDKPNSSEKARMAFYQRWTDDYTFEQIIRFARVLTALCGNLRFIKLITPELPSWFLYLLYDGLITTLPICCDNEDRIDERKNWSIKQLHELLEIEESGLGKKLLFAIFDRQNITYRSCFSIFLYD